MEIDGKYFIYSKTGDIKTRTNTKILTKDWIKQIQDLGAGEIVLNCMNQDGVKNGYDIKQLNYLKTSIKVPLIASGGAGSKIDFYDVFYKTNISGALAASVFHSNDIPIQDLKNYLIKRNINIRK